MMRRLVIGAGGLTRAVGPVRFGTSRDKVVSVEDAVYLIPDGATVTVGGFAAQGAPEYVCEALGQRFRETGSPKDLTLLFGVGPGDSVNRGLNHLALPGMLKRTIGAHYGQAPMLGKMAADGAFEAYFLSLGSVSRMIRCAAGGSPGHFTKAGFGTMMDPALGGGKMNSRTTEDIVKVMEVEGEKYLFYKALPIDVALIRGTTADPEGNVTMERESLYCDHLMQAIAGRSRRGVVIAQVERVAAAGSLQPRNVRIPATMVDCVVQAPAEKHQMSYSSGYRPTWTGEVRSPSRTQDDPTMQLDERKVIARRALMEALPDDVISLGLGLPVGIAQVADEEHVLKDMQLTTEPGVHGGVGAAGLNFGPAANGTALLEIHSQFDFYTGGGLDVCFLGNMETDAMGNVNVTRVGTKLTGPGGFIDISHATKRVNMMGTMTAGGLVVEVKDGKLRIVKEGTIKKFVSNVQEIAFSGAHAIKNQQVVKYITERCVFALRPEGLELIEIAPGVDLQKDVLDQMEFMPIIRRPLGPMDPAIFREESMRLAKKVSVLDYSGRVVYIKQSNACYIDLKNATIYDRRALEATKKAHDDIRAYVAKNGKVNAIVTSDNFRIAPQFLDEHKAMTKRLEDDCYLTVRRCSSRAFTMHRLAAAFNIAGSMAVAPMSVDEAFGEFLKRGVEVPRSEFELAFSKHSSGRSKIAAEEMQQLALSLVAVQRTS